MHSFQIRLTAVGLAATVSLFLAPFALAQSAVDQYSESLPTAGGQKATRGAVSGDGSQAGQTTIPPATRAALEKSKEGAATARAAKLTAPTPARSGGATPGASASTDDGGLGLLLPLILAATLLVAAAIFFARRRPGPTPG